MASPFPYIDELHDVENINGFNDILKILGMVYTTVPWTVVPFTDQVHQKDLESLYARFKKLEIGGWCGLNAEYFKWIIEGYKAKTPPLKHESYNFGFSFSLLIAATGPGYMGFTHVGIIVTIDGMEFFFDPYFGRYFAGVDGFPLQFKDLLYLIRERKFDRYKPVYVPLKKPVVREDGSVSYLYPLELMNEVFGIFEQQGLNKILHDVFGTGNRDSLMLLKIPN